MFKLLGALLEAVWDGANKLADSQREHLARYEAYSDDRLLSEFDRLRGSSDVARRSAVMTVMKRRGLRPNDM
ncbi:MAG: hypothetical protein VKS61_12645 [Candidatus Sericytochromatia bacterium]|nr:hypothetical protein [Candidatus Sericytochromatia bacterium]